MKVTLINKLFSHEEGGEMEEAIADAVLGLNNGIAHKNKHGFLTGRFKLKLEYIENEHGPSAKTISRPRRPKV